VERGDPPAVWEQKPFKKTVSDTGRMKNTAMHVRAKNAFLD
jgi:hypothetical protein